MNRRKLLAAIAGLPFIGALVPKSIAGDGVALRSIAHPHGLAHDGELSEAAMETVEIELPVYALGGETVTCENGHPICDFARTVMIGQNQNLPRDLTNWRQPEPTVGQLQLPLCQTCGGKFYLMGGIFHIGDRWRDPHGMIAKHGMQKA